MKPLAIALLIVLSSAAYGLDCREKAHGAIAADILSTRWALDRGAVEANPLYGTKTPSNKALLAGGLVRAAIVEINHRYGNDWANCFVAGFTAGVAAQNMLFDQDDALKGAAAIGVGFTIYQW